MRDALTTMTSPLRNMMTLLAVAMLVSLSVGCSDDDNPVTGPGGGLGDGAQVRVVHASPDAPAVDIYAAGVTTPLATNVAYGETTDYLDVAPGVYNFELRAAGSPAGSNPAYETGDLTVPEGARITAVAQGLLLGSTGPADAFRVQVYAESFADPGANNAAVRIIHAGADAPTVALDVGNDGQPEITGFARFAETGPDGVALPAGAALQIAVWAGAPLERVTVFTTPPLGAGDELFVIATGLLDGTLPREADGFSLLAVNESGTIGFIKQNPVVFALHASPDAPAVDIFVGGTNTELVDNLTFAGLSAPIQVPPGSYGLDFRAHDNGAVAATVDVQNLSAGERYLAVASGFLSNGTPSFTLLPYSDAFGLSGTGAHVRVVHASPDAPLVDVGPVSGGQVSAVPDYSDLDFGDASAASGTPLPAQNLNIGIAAANSTTPVATFNVTTTAGSRAYAIAAGSLQSNGEAFRLLLVETSVFPWVRVEVLPN